jgi:hypothetical protein
VEVYMQIVFLISSATLFSPVMISVSSWMLTPSWFSREEIVKHFFDHYNYVVVYSSLLQLQVQKVGAWNSLEKFSSWPFVCLKHAWVYFGHPSWNWDPSMSQRVQGVPF